MHPPRNPIQRHLAILASGIVLVGLSIACVDRPASTWSHAHLHAIAAFANGSSPFWARVGLNGIGVFGGLAHLVNPLVPAAVVGLAIVGIAAAFGEWRPREGGMTVIACCLAVLVSVAAKDLLKFAFGRTWPETWMRGAPSWIGTGAFGFHPFHGGYGWSAFPSGHMTQTAALVAVLWRRLPRWRWVWATFILLAAAALFGADYHFVGDIVAGIYLGSACAAGVLALLRDRPPRDP